MSINEEEFCSCPICFDIIGEKNNIVTECGHKFHASCLMTNISHNGFECPCCRNIMAKDLDKENETESSTSDDDDDDETYNTVYDVDTLRGFRLFMNLAEGYENDEEDITEEDEYNTEIEREREENAAAAPPSLENISDILKSQGISYDQLLSYVLTDFDEYDDQYSFKSFANFLWVKIREVINNSANQHNILEDID